MKKEQTLFRIVPAHQPASRGSQHVATLRVTRRGRFTIPKTVRDKFGLKGGETLKFVKQSDRSYLVKLAQ